MTHLSGLISLLAALSAGGLAVAAPAVAQGRLSLAQARRIALKAHPGAIIAQELEKEAGGSGLRYSFDIRASGKVQEVGVDARTGRVLENAAEGPHPD